MVKIKFLIIVALIFNTASTDDKRSYVCSNLTNDMKSNCNEIDTDLIPQMTNLRSISKNARSVKTAIENGTLYVINIWVMVPFQDENYMFSKRHMQAAVYRAITDAGADLCENTKRFQNEYLNKTCFNVAFNDTKCDADYTQNQASDIHNSRLISEECGSDNASPSVNNMDTFVGMTCDLAAGRVGTFANHWGWPVIFAGTRTISFDTKNNTSCCDTMSRTGHSAWDFGKFVFNLYEKFDWNTSYLVYISYSNHGAPIHYSSRSDCSTIMSGVTKEFQRNNWISYSEYTLMSYSSDQDIVKNAAEILSIIKDHSRVSLWCIGRKAMHYVMTKARELGMTNGEYSFLYIDLYNTNTSYTWSDGEDQNIETYDYNVTIEDTEENREAMRALQVLSIYQPETEEFRNFSNEMKAVEEEEGIAGPWEYVNPFVVQYYNAIRLLTIGVERSLQDGMTNLSDGRAFTRYLWGSSYESVDGKVTIGEEGDRLMDYTIMDLNIDNWKFETSLIYFGYNQSFANDIPIDWPYATVPVNKPECGYLPCPVQDLTVGIKIAIGVSVGFVLLFQIFFFIMYRFVKEQRLQKMSWKCKWSDLVFRVRKESNKSIENSTISHSSAGSDSYATGAIGRQLFTKTGIFKNNTVAIKTFEIQKINLNRSLLVEMQQMMQLESEHICQFIGASVENPIFILSEYCQRGSLQDVLEGSTEYELDDVFRISLISDIAHGMNYLHHRPIGSHGNLKSSNCLVDSRFVVKISDFGLSAYRAKGRRNSDRGYGYYKNLLWKAPELLRSPEPPQNGTQKGDVYSFAIIVQEIMYRKGVFYLGNEVNHDPKEICSYVMSPPDVKNPFRPTLEDNDDVVIRTSIRNLVQECWDENPESRPSFENIAKAIKKRNKQKNLVESLLKRLEQYSHHLEEKVEERTQQYKAEKDRADTLLYQMLPQTVAEKLKSGQTVCPETYDSVTIYFSDIVGFTAISHESTAIQVVEMLNNLYTEFDRVVDRLDVYKVETIGDAYMVVSGLPVRNGTEHAREIGRMALALLKVVRNFTIVHMPDTRMQLRIGIHSGPVVAGVVGLKMPRYCLFGDTVNTAARMEQNGKPLKIHISPSTKKLMEDSGSFRLEQREDSVLLKGLGNWETWWLMGEEIPIGCEDNIGTRSNEEQVTPKISGSSGYSTSSSGTQCTDLQVRERNRVRKSVTGVYESDEEYFYPEDTPQLDIPDVFTYEAETRRPRCYDSRVQRQNTRIIESYDGDAESKSLSATSSGGESGSSARRIRRKTKPKEKIRRHGSVEGRSDKLKEFLPKWLEKQKKRSSSGLKDETSSIRAEPKKKKKNKTARVKFADDDREDENLEKNMLAKSSALQKVSRDSGIEVTFENKTFCESDDEENTKL